MTDVDISAETVGQMIDRLDCDGSKWAAEFRRVAVRIGYSDMDEGWLIGWFANAIERAAATHPDVRRLRAEVDCLCDHSSRLALR